MTKRFGTASTRASTLTAALALRRRAGSSPRASARQTTPRRCPLSTTYWGIVAVGLICVLAAPAHAEDQVAVIGLEHEDEPVPQAWVDATRAAIEAEERAWVMPGDEVRATLSAGQLLGGDTGARQFISKMQDGIDAYYDGQLETAEKTLTSAIDRALEQPMVLAIDDNLSQQVRAAMLVLPRVLLGTARFDEAGAVTERAVAAFPRWKPSRKKYPPEVLDLVEQSRVRHAASAQTLLLTPTSPSETCEVNLNGDRVLLDSEQQVPVATAAYGLMLECGELTVGPFLLTIKRSDTTLPVGSDALQALEPAQTGKPMTLPTAFQSRRDLGVLLTSLLDVDTVYLVTRDGESALMVRVTRDGQAVAARTDGEATPELAAALLRSTRSGEPAGTIAVDRGHGFERAEQPSYIVEYIVLGVGGATVIAGGALLGVAASQADTVRDCKVRGACGNVTEQDNNTLYTDDLFVGHLLLGLGGAMIVGGGTSLLIRMLTADTPSEPTSVSDRIDIVPTSAGAIGTWTLTW